MYSPPPAAIFRERGPDGSHELVAADRFRHSAQSRNPFIGRAVEGGGDSVFTVFLSAEWALRFSGRPPTFDS